MERHSLCCGVAQYGIGIWGYLFDICFVIKHNVIVIIKRGFTLIELMLVVGLIMILSVVGIGTYMQATVKSRDAQRKNDLSQLSKAAETFYTDIGRYPLADSENKMYCVIKVGSVVTNTSCGDRLYAVIDGVNTEYIAFPEDPVPTQEYVYTSSDGQTFAIYTAIENLNDRDLLKDANGDLIEDPWGIDCQVSGSSVPCNYSVTETGKVRN